MLSILFWRIARLLNETITDNGPAQMCLYLCNLHHAFDHGLLTASDIEHLFHMLMWDYDKQALKHNIDSWKQAYAEYNLIKHAL